MTAKIKKTYYYVPCDAGNCVNSEYRHYFRLYADSGDGKPLLVQQGLADKIDEWEKDYHAVMNVNNPYPTLD